MIINGDSREILADMIERGETVHSIVSAPRWERKWQSAALLDNVSPLSRLRNALERNEEARNGRLEE